MYTNNLARARLAVLTLAAGLMASVWLFTTAGATATTANAEVKPSAASALATDEKLATAIRNNDAKGIEQLLSDDWAVVATTGGIGEGKSVFPNGIKSGFLVRTTYEFSDPRVRLYGNPGLHRASATWPSGETSIQEPRRGSCSATRALKRPHLSRTSYRSFCPARGRADRIAAPRSCEPKTI